MAFLFEGEFAFFIVIFVFPATSVFPPLEFPKSQKSPEGRVAAKGSAARDMSSPATTSSSAWKEKNKLTFPLFLGITTESIYQLGVAMRECPEMEGGMRK